MTNQDAPHFPHNHARRTVQLLRSFDGLLYGSLILAAVLLFPRLRQTPLLTLDVTVAVPALILALAALWLPAQLPAGDGAWRCTTLRLKTAGLCMAGLSPFLSWWLRSPSNLYFTAVAVLALLSGIWFAVELASEMRALAVEHEDERLAVRAAMARRLLLYLLLAPFLAVKVTFLVTIATEKGILLRDFPAMWQVTPVLLRVAMLFPLFELFVVLLQTRRMLSRRSA